MYRKTEHHEKVGRSRGGPVFVKKCYAGPPEDRPRPARLADDLGRLCLLGAEDSSSFFFACARKEKKAGRKENKNIKKKDME